MTTTLPDNILALVEQSPIEDLLLPILRADMPGVKIQSLIEDKQTFPLVLIRRLPHLGNDDGDDRFTDVASVVAHTFADGLNGDEDAALLADAVRVVMRNAGKAKRSVPGLGSLSRVRTTSRARRVTDWATATGPVQYADLPTGVWRYEIQFEIEVRKPLTNPFPLP